MASSLRGYRLTDDVEDRGEEVDVTDSLIHNTTSQFLARKAKNQWYVNGAVVDEEAVESLAMLAKALAMVTGEDQQRSVQEVAFIECLRNSPIRESV